MTFKPSYWGYGLGIVPVPALIALQESGLSSHRWGGNIPGYLFLGSIFAAAVLLIIGLWKKSSPPKFHWKIAFIVLMLPVLWLDVYSWAGEVWHICADAIYEPGSQKASAVAAYERYWKAQPVANDVLRVESLNDPIVAILVPDGWLVGHRPEYCNLLGRHPIVMLDGAYLLLDRNSFRVLEDMRGLRSVPVDPRHPELQGPEVHSP